MSQGPESTRPPAEKAVVAALVLEGTDSAAAHEPLAEITALAEAAGANVVEAIVQYRRSAHPRTAFGAGKVEEIKAICEQTCAKLVIVDFDLSPTQGLNLEKEIDLRVIDRTELILDIFATRARTRQAMLQVELAQTEYSRPRLKRLWTHLERQEGAIGTRGPGETQIETDRRLLDQKIARLRRRLKEIENRRQREAQSRTLATTVSLVGYTNAGKSSLMQRLTGADVYVADQLFATLDTRVRKWKLADKREVLLTDTVGFVRDLPHHLVASFHATLEETLQADLLLHVCDASDPDLDIHLRSVDDVLEELGAGDMPRLLVFNKIDCVADQGRLTVLATAYPDAVCVSALTGEGMAEFDAAVAAQLDRWSLRLEVEVPAGAGQALAAVRRHAHVASEAYVDGNWKAELSILPRAWGGIRGDLARAGAVHRALDEPS